jgi:hypothetical protein
MDIWIYGYMDIWIYGYMDIWIYGRTLISLIIKVYRPNFLLLFYRVERKMMNQNLLFERREYQESIYIHQSESFIIYEETIWSQYCRTNRVI